MESEGPWNAAVGVRSRARAREGGMQCVLVSGDRACFLLLCSHEDTRRNEVGGVTIGSSSQRMSFVCSDVRHNGAFLVGWCRGWKGEGGREEEECLARVPSAHRPVACCLCVIREDFRRGWGEWRWSVARPAISTSRLRLASSFTPSRSGQRLAPGTLQRARPAGEACFAAWNARRKDRLLEDGTRATHELHKYEEHVAESAISTRAIAYARRTRLATIHGSCDSDRHSQPPTSETRQHGGDFARARCFVYQ